MLKCKQIEEKHEDVYQVDNTLAEYKHKTGLSTFTNLFFIFLQQTIKMWIYVYKINYCEHGTVIF